MNDDLVTITVLTEIVVKLSDLPGAGSAVATALRVIEKHLDSLDTSAQATAMTPSTTWVGSPPQSLGDAP